MIKVFVEYAAADEPPIEVFEDATGWRVGKSGHLSVGEWVDNECFHGLAIVYKTYAPGAWRYVTEECEHEWGSGPDDYAQCKKCGAHAGEYKPLFSAESGAELGSSDE